MRCPACGFENPDGTVFCISCGTPLVQGQSGAQATRYSQPPQQYQPAQYAGQPSQPQPQKSKKPAALVVGAVAAVAIVAVLLLALNHGGTSTSGSDNGASPVSGISSTDGGNGGATTDGGATVSSLSFDGHWLAPTGTSVFVFTINDSFVGVERFSSTGEYDVQSGNITADGVATLDDVDEEFSLSSNGDGSLDCLMEGQHLECYPASVYLGPVEPDGVIIELAVSDSCAAALYIDTPEGSEGEVARCGEYDSGTITYTDGVTATLSGAGNGIYAYADSLGNELTMGELGS